MRKLYYLVSAAAIATIVAAWRAGPCSIFSEMMGSWGYGGYGAFHVVLWALSCSPSSWASLGGSGPQMPHARRVSARPGD
jgi:hypothetical protein